MSFFVNVTSYEINDKTFKTWLVILRFSQIFYGLTLKQKI